MPAQSQQQQKLFGLALSVKRGETPRSEASKEVLDIVDSMTEKDIEDFASTSHEGLPKKVEAVLRELVRNAIKDNVVSGVVNEHKDCGCGCKGTTVGGCNTSLTEGLFQNIMKGVKTGSGPFTLVVIKDNKVVKQVTVSTPQAVPAGYTTLEKQYPSARIRIEDATGKMVFGEAVVDSEFSPMGYAQKVASGKMDFYKASKEAKIPFIELLKLVKKINKNFVLTFESVVNESSIEEAIPVGFEMGDFVHFKSKNKTGMVKRIDGDKVTIMTMKGDFTGDIKDIKVLYQDNLNEKLDNKQLALLKYAYKDIKKINPSEPAYGRLVKHLDTLSKSELQQLADAGINFISLLAKNRLMRNESVNEATDRDFEKVYSIFDKKDYFGLKGSIKTMLGNWQRALDKGDKGAQQYSEEDVINSVTAQTKARAKHTYDELVKAINNKDIKTLKSKLRHDQPFSIAIFSQTTGKKLPKSTRDIHSFLDNEFMSESVNEAASRTAMEIGGLTGMNKDAVQKFVDTHNLDIEKVFQFVKKGKLSDRMDFMTAVAGKPGNPIQKKMIKMFK